MNQNTMLRFASLSLCAVLLTAVLTACGGSGSRNTTTTGTTSASSTTTSTSATSDTRTNSHGTETGTGTGTGINGGVDGILNGNGTNNGNITGSGGVIDEMMPSLENLDLANATVRFNGADYRVSAEEELRRDEIGEELLTVEQTTDTLKNDGDATGLPAGVKVWSIKDNTDYSAIAVEIDGMFYRANRQAD